jgi:hypothetical protein
LARIATTSEDMQPDVAPVGFDFDGTYFYVGGINLPTNLKYKKRSKKSQSVVSGFSRDERRQVFSPGTGVLSTSYLGAPHRRLFRQSPN